MKKFISIFLITLLFELFSAEAAKANTIDFDPIFGNGGKVITSFGHDAGIARTAIQSDGKIVVVGSASNGSIYGWAISRYNLDGTLDITFGNNGIVTKYFAANSNLNAVAIQADGKIVVGGNSNNGNGCFPSEITPYICWTLARYDLNGTPDAAFGNNGIIITPIDTYNFGPQSIQSLAIQTDGKIVAVGTTADVGVVRYNIDGSIDFKEGIIIPPDYNCNPTFFPNQSCSNTGDGANAVRIQQDGKIVISGTWSQYGVFQSHAYTLRLNSDGNFDTAFGTGGLSRTSIMFKDGLNDMILQQDGKIVVTGGGCETTDCSGGGDTFVARLTSTGNFDSNFGNNGKVIYSIAGNDASTSLILQLDGKIILGGYEDTGLFDKLDFVLRRLNPDGSPDSTFGNDGSFVTSIGQNNDAISGISLQNDGKLVAVGNTSNGSYNEWVIARFLGMLVNLTPFINTISNTTIYEGHVYALNGSFIDGDSTSWSATAEYGDGSGVQPLVLSGANFSLSHPYKDNGVYTVTVKVTDDQGATGVKTAIVTVNNLPPSTGTITIPTDPITINTSMTATASFTDQGVLDSHTATWNWGDGTRTDPASVNETNGSGTVSDSHVYTQAGVYTITLTLKDKDNGIDTKTTTSYIVVYDPAGGFITGSGHINSPKGAYTPNPDAAGTTKFGIHAKYKDNTPQGKTKLNFKEANLDFESTSYDWYVITGNKAQLKGKGTINSAGDYTFLATIINTGEPEGERTDTIRIKITDANNAVIYDNQMGAPDITDPITPIENGSIKIHK